MEKLDLLVAISNCIMLKYRKSSRGELDEVFLESIEYLF
ncbi:hypothetical protein RR47_GL000150 [Enterococcus columbae DSM 7374 = ATCC 51263]|nr:hypothetical protein RR47_GL000150 [Enterococcus columbae DSM 7374 = ATCC 51263]